MKKWLLTATLLLSFLPLSAWADQVTCESQRNGRTECEMDTHGVVSLQRQLSHAACVEDVSWGYTKHALWVDKGCRGVFISDGQQNSSSGSGGPSHEQVHACNDRKGGYGHIVSSSELQSGAYEVILDYNDGQYVCNVDRYSEVTYFERMRNQSNQSSQNQYHSKESNRGRDPENDAESNCMIAVNNNYGGNVRQLGILSSSFSQANTEVMIIADGERWQCLISSRGEIDELRVIE